MLYVETAKIINRIDRWQLKQVSRYSINDKLLWIKDIMEEYNLSDNYSPRHINKVAKDLIYYIERLTK